MIDATTSSCNGFGAHDPQPPDTRYRGESSAGRQAKDSESARSSHAMLRCSDALLPRENRAESSPASARPGSAVARSSAVDR